jgi:hypothetical protein
MTGRRVLAGERLPGMSVSHTGLGLARAQLARPRNGNDPSKVDRSPLFASQKLGGGGAFEELNPVREIKPVKVRKYGRQPEPGQGRHNKQRKLREREQREQ